MLAAIETQEERRRGREASEIGIWGAAGALARDKFRNRCNLAKRPSLSETLSATSSMDVAPPPPRAARHSERCAAWAGTRA